MRTEINEKEVPVQEVFKRGFFYGSGTQDATDRRRKKMAELIDDVERGISSGSTVLDYLIKNGLEVRTGSKPS